MGFWIMRATRRKTATVAALAVLALSVFVPVSAVAEVTEQHCPGANEANAPAVPEGYEALGKVEALGNELDEVVSSAAYVCVKGGPYASGIVAPAGRTMRQILEDAGITVGTDNVPGVSYYMTYRRPTVDVTVTIAKQWTGVEVGPEAARNLRFDVTIGDQTQRIGVGGTATFSGLLVGGEYTITWAEDLQLLPEEPFEDDQGNVCTFDREGSTVGGSQTFTAGAPGLTDLVGAPGARAFTFTAVNDYDCVPRPESVSVTAAKTWTGDLSEAPAGSNIRFEVSLGAQTQEIGVGGTATFTGLVPGDGYTIEWSEIAASRPGPFTNAEGERCEFRAAGSIVSGSLGFIAGQVSSLGFTALNDYECTPPSILTTQASVEVVKVWTLDDEVVPAPEGVELAFDVTLGSTTRTMSGVGTEVFTGLTPGTSYPVSVEEDLSALPDADTLFGVGCELVSSDLVLSATSVTAPGSVTATVTNAYECAEAQDEVLVAVDVEAAKTWYQTSANDPVALEQAPAGAEPSYEVVITGPDAEQVLEAELAAGDSLTVPELVEGASYLVTWEEIDPLEEFDLDGATCTWSEEDSTFVGSETFVAGEIDTVCFTGVNVYECIEVEDEVLPQTGASTIWLGVLGLLSLGIGGGLLGGRRRG
jgi:LPXTG-motif cell wall-anchored protein